MEPEITETKKNEVLEFCTITSDLLINTLILKTRFS